MAVNTVIVGAPLQELLPAYRPMQYQVSVAGTLTDFKAALKVDVYINGAKYGSTLPYEPKIFVNNIGAAVNGFEFTVHERVQQYFKEINYWPDLASSTPLVSTAFVAKVKIRVVTLYPDSAGVLQEEAGFVDSPEVPVINAWRRSDESASLRAYDMTTKGATDQLKLLTFKPSRSIVTLTSSEWLGVYVKGLTSLQIISYQADGTETKGQIAVGSTVFQAEELAIVPVGAANINAIDIGDWLPNTSQVVIDENTTHYIVQAGWHCPDGNFVGFTQIRRYHLVPDDCLKYRVHFINAFGAVDSFGVYNQEAVSFAVSSETYTKALPANFGIIDENTTKVQSTGRLSVEASVGNITKEVRKWLARELPMAPMVRLEKGGQFYPVTVENGTFPIEDTEQPLAKVNFTLVYSQADTSQRR